MPRARGGPKTRQRRKKVFKLAKGYSGRRKNIIRVASFAVERGLAEAFAGRRLKKRDMRALWQVRISAAAKANGLSYSALMGALTKKRIQLNRKMLAALALDHPEDFAAVAELAKG